MPSDIITPTVRLYAGQINGAGIVTNAGFNAAVQCLAGESGAVIYRLAVGTSDEPLAQTDTMITDAILFPFKSIEYPDYKLLKLNFEIPFEAGVGMGIKEFGLITVDGRLFARMLHEPISKGEVQILGHVLIKI